jgi:hypothetical protein
MNTLRQPLLREITTALLMAVLLLQSATAVAPGPAWWGSQSVADPYAIPDDFAVANAGQLKYLATKAAAAMNAELPGGAGETINTMVAAWNASPAQGVTRDNYLAINQGQLKQVAAPFYDRLGLPYPWADGSAGRDNYLLVNVGQLKHAFSFELKFRTVGQGPVTIPDATLLAAQAQWYALAVPDRPLGSTADDLDGDGIPNLQDYLMDPTKPLFDPDDLDGDRIPDSIEDASGGILSKLDFADAVRDHDGDGVMNFEEVLLGLNLNGPTTSGRADGFTDAEVLAWRLAAGTPLVPSTDAARALWEVIDADWLDANVGGDYYLYWLNEADANNDSVPDGLAAFRADMANFVWQPPSIWRAYPEDCDGDSLPDLWEYRYAFDLRDGQDAWDDPDEDGLVNGDEYQQGTNPLLADSDGDGFNDGLEYWQGGDPLLAAVGPPLVMQVVGSGYQAIYTGQTTPALAVKVTQGGMPVAGITAMFDLAATSGRLRPASNTLGTPGSSLSVTTASDGVAAVTYEAGAQAGTASISASTAGVTATAQFSVSIVAIPAVYGGEGSTNGGGGYGGSTTAPPPPRSTAASAGEIAANSSDGFRIRVRQKDDEDASYPAAEPFPQYLGPYGMNPVALVGYQPFEPHTWQRHAQLEFEALAMSGPFRKPVVPRGVRRYLVLVYQGANVEPGTPDAPKHVGVLTFQYSETGARVITLTDGIPDQFIKLESNKLVTFEPSAATKAEERVWITLLPMEVRQRSDNGDGTFGDFVSVSELRPTRWRNMFRNGNESLDDDPDQIMIRLNGLRSSQETFRLNLGVTEITGKSNSISKDEDDVVAAWEANDVEVMPMMHLVTDSTDDNYSGVAAESTTQKDDYVGDRTHIVSLGATVELKIEGSETGDLPPIRVPVKGADGKVEFRVFVLSPNGLGGVNQFGPISNEAKIAHEVYEQIGVSMDWLSTVTAPFPENLPSSIPLNDPNHELTPDEVDTLVGLLPDPTDKSVIDVYYLPCQMKHPNGGTASGQFVRSLKPGKGKYGLVLISIQRNTLVLAHELGHACNLAHQPAPNRPWWLMKDGGVIDTFGIYNSKRFHWQEENIIKSNQNAYYIPLH